MNRSKLRTFEFLLALAVLAYAAWLAYRQAFWFFERYDDEGYMIVALQHYLRDGGLYTKTFAQYGPFYFYMQQLMHALFHIPVTHDGGRTLTLLYWLLSAALAGLFIFRLSGRMLLSALVVLGTLMVSVVLKKEPGHPQEVVLTLLEVGLCVTLLAKSRRVRSMLFLLGTLGAFLCLSKVNTGIFFLMAAFISFACVLRRGPVRTAILVIASVGGVLMPLALMHANARTWARGYCILETGCIALFLWIAVRVEFEDVWSMRDLFSLCAGLVTGSALILGIAAAQGLTPSILFRGVVLLPLRQPNVFFIPLVIPRADMRTAGFLVVAAAIAWWFRSRESLQGVAIVKVIVGATAMVMLAVDDHEGLVLTLPLLALAFWQVKGTVRSTADMFPRLFLSAIVVFEFLQAYPVAGSQLEIGLTPAMAWGGLLVSDGLRALKSHPEERIISRLAWFMKPGFSQLTIFCLFGALVFQAGTCLGIRRRGAALNLPGATRLRVTDEDARIYRELTSDIRANCDTLFTMPGMYSLNLWSGVPTPNGLNMTGWMNAFTTDQQEDILHTLRERKHPCTVYNSGLMVFWNPAGQANLVFSPLAHYVKTQMKTIAEVSTYELKVPIGADGSQIGESK